MKKEIKKLESRAIDCLKEKKCEQCGGDGRLVEIEATHGCDGTDENCAMICPVPEQVQVGCKYCEGSGYTH